MRVQLRWCATNTPCVDEVMDLEVLPRFGDAMDNSDGETFVVVDTHWFPSDELCGVMLILYSLDSRRAIEARGSR